MLVRMHSRRLTSIAALAFVVMIEICKAEDCSGSCAEDPERILKLEKELRTVVRRLEGLVDLETEVRDLRESDSFQEKLIEDLASDIELTKKSKSDPKSESALTTVENDKQGNSDAMSSVNNEVARGIVENITRTFLKEQLKEFSKKVDAVVNEGENRKFHERLQRLETTLQYLSRSMVSVDSNLKAMRSSFQSLNSTIENKITRRLNILETNAVEDRKFKELENKVKHLVENRELLEDQLAAVLHKTPDAEEVLCELPHYEDSHLLSSVNADDAGGMKTLRFGCQPIGQYVLNSVFSPVICENGTWTGSHPTCVRLLNATEINTISEEMKDENPCEGRNGDFPDTSNCKRFFSCWNGRTTLMNCPHDLHFNNYARRCDHPLVAKCSPVENPKVKKLEDIIPPIIVHTEELHATSDQKELKRAGQLLVVPGKNFSLQCLFPDTVWGLPSWYVHYTQPYLQPSPPIITKLRNGISITVSSAKRENSGIYICYTPFGKEHGLPVLVQELRKVNKWKCPPLYTRHIPDLILERDEAQQTINFKCGGGLRLVGNSFTRCRDDGVWSHGSLPRCKP